MLLIKTLSLVVGVIFTSLAAIKTRLSFSLIKSLTSVFKMLSTNAFIDTSVLLSETVPLVSS